MDSDFLATRLAAAAAKRQSNHHHLSRVTSEFDVEGEEEADHSFQFDVASLCSHLEADNSFKSKPAVCPICWVKVTGYMLSQITVQHGYSFKLQRRSQLRRIPFPNNQSLSLMGRDLREAHLQVLLRSSVYLSNNNTATSSTAAATDNSLSSANNVASQHIWKSSLQSLSRDEREERMRQAAGRAVFVQELLFSTLLAD